MISEKDLQLIDLYLANDLGGDERNAFELRLKGDAELADKVQLERDLRKALSSDAFDFRKELLTVESQYHSQEQLKKTQKKTEATGSGVRRMRPWMAIAAGLALLVVAAWWFSQNNSGSLSHQELYAANFKPYPNNINVRNNNAQRGAFQKGMDLYDRKMYVEAIQYFEEATLETPSDTSFFFKGLAQLSRAEGNEAILSLQEVGGFEKSIFSVQAQWYIALAHLQQGRANKTKRILQQIIQEQKDDVYTRKARSLVQQIK